VLASPRQREKVSETQRQITRRYLSGGHKWLHVKKGRRSEPKFNSVCASWEHSRVDFQKGGYQGGDEH